MNNPDRKDFLERSAAFHAESADFEKSQYLSSFALAGMGLAWAGVGVGLVAKGEVASGAFCIATGTPMAVAFAKDGLDDVRNYGEEKHLAGAREAAAKELG